MKAITLARWVTLGALFAIPLLALFVDRSLLFPYVAGRGFGFRILVEIAFAGWLLLALSDRAYRPRISAILLVLGVYVAWMGLADVFAVNPHKAFWGNLERMDGWITLVHLLAFVLVMGAVLGPEGLWRRWWLTFVGASGLVCGYGLLQMANLAPTSHGSPRIDALFGNPEFLAGYLLFAMTATLWLAFDIPSGRFRAARWGLCGLAALQAVVLFASGTRGALVGLVAAIAVCALVGAMAAGRAGRRAGLVALGGTILAVGALVWFRDAPVIAQDPILTRFANIRSEDLQVRFTLWRMAYEAFLARPVIGWGQEGFVHVFNRFYDPSLAGQEPWFDRAHNVYLDILIAGGLPALLLFLTVLAVAAHGLWRDPLTRPGRIVLLGGLVAYAVQGLVVFDNLMTSMPLAAMLAMPQATRLHPRVGATPAGLDPRWAGRVVAPAVVASLMLVIWFVNVPTLRASRDLIEAIAPVPGGPVRLAYLKYAVDRGGFASQEVCERLGKIAVAVAASADAPEPQRGRFLAYAIDQLRRELAGAPHEVRLRLQLARLYRSVGDRESTRRELTAALADAPRNPWLLREVGLDEPPLPAS